MNIFSNFCQSQAVPGFAGEMFAAATHWAAWETKYVSPCMRDVIITGADMSCPKFPFRASMLWFIKRNYVGNGTVLSQTTFWAFSCQRALLKMYSWGRSSKPPTVRAFVQRANMISRPLDLLLPSSWLRSSLRWMWLGHVNLEKISFLLSIKLTDFEQFQT